MSISARHVELGRPAERHLKKTLPPTLSGFPGEAEIRYYVKATVTRHAFWKENPRTYLPINFLPIEPPRQGLSSSEVYARQKHSFNPSTIGEAPRSRVKSLFGKSKEAGFAMGSSHGPLDISVDARLPAPGILTCSQDIPLRLVVKKMSETEASLSLQSLQISLLASTKIRAHGVFRTETSSWIVTSQSNMSTPILTTSNRVSVGGETVLANKWWRGFKLPNTIAPSFQACNIERTYQLDVRIGLQSTGPVHYNAKVRNVNNENIRLTPVENGTDQLCSQRQ